MRIPCPHCGLRSLDEFVYRGDATVSRPDPADPLPDGGLPAPGWMSYVYLRDNPMGEHQELWWHAGGCQAWLVITRDLRDHRILGARAAADAARSGT